MRTAETGAVAHPVLAGLAASCLLLGCAGQVPPAGGPADITPPVIIRTLPDTNAVRVETRALIFEFSKYVDRRSFEEALFISPYLGELQFDWSGREVSVRFAGPLRRNATYVANVGTDVVDLRGGNRMASGFTLAFSTGDSIDRGAITGKVVDQRPEGVMVFAYALQGRDPDTLNPSVTKPDYLMQTGRDGAYALSNLAYGTYRIVAVRDEYRNLLYDKQVDEYGVPAGDITLSSDLPRRQHVDMRLAREDTARPFLVSARAVDQFHVMLRFSEAIDSLTFDSALVTIRDTLRGTTVPVAAQYLSRAAPTTAGLETAMPLDSASGFRVAIRGIRDRAGNALDLSHSSEPFGGSPVPDTARLTVSVPGLTDSTHGFALDQPIELNFSRPPIRGAAAAGFALLDSTRARVPGKLRWPTATDMQFRPGRELLSGAWYQVTLRLDSLRNLRGAGARDSTFRLRFRTVDIKTMGYVKGRVTDTVRSRQGPIVVGASSIDLSPVRRRSIRLAAPGAFTLDRLAEGRYVLDAYRDRDSSGTYNAGSVYPFTPSEPFTVYPDTVKVRARWGVEGLELRFH